MNLVFPASISDWNDWKTLFSEELVFGRWIRTEQEWTAFRVLMEKHPTVLFAVILDSFNPQLWNKVFSSKALSIVIGKSTGLCMQAVQQKADFLVSPFLGNKAWWDFSILELAKQNGTEIAVLFSDVLNAVPVDRCKWFQQSFFLAFACKKKRVPFHVFSGAKNHEENRSEADLLDLRVLLEKGF